MTLEMKIQMEREDAAIMATIKTSRRYHANDDEIIGVLISEFGLTEEEAGERIREYENSTFATGKI